jgi:hypothetical protein
MTFIETHQELKKIHSTLAKGTQYLENTISPLRNKRSGCLAVNLADLQDLWILFKIIEDQVTGLQEQVKELEKSILQELVDTLD